MDQYLPPCSARDSSPTHPSLHLSPHSTVPTQMKTSITCLQHSVSVNVLSLSSSSKPSLVFSASAIGTQTNTLGLLTKSSRPRHLSPFFSIHSLLYFSLQLFGSSLLNPSEFCAVNLIFFLCTFFMCLSFLQQASHVTLLTKWNALRIRAKAMRRLFISPSSSVVWRLSALKELSSSAMKRLRTWKKLK